MKIFDVPEWDGQRLYSQQHPGKRRGDGGEAMNRRKMFEIEPFTIASRIADSRAKTLEIMTFATKLNGDLGIFAMSPRNFRLLAAESPSDTPYAVVNKGRFPSRRRFCLHLFALRAKR